MFSIPMKKTHERIAGLRQRIHNMPEDMQRAEIDAELEKNWNEVMGKAEKYVQGQNILANGGWFSTMSLGNWVTLCAEAGVEIVPSRLGAVINPLMIFDISMNGMTDRQMEAFSTFLQGFQDIAEDEIIRFDTSAPGEVKAIMALGRDSGASPAWKGYTRNETGIVFPKVTDERLVTNLMENPENASPVWIRKWIEPVMMQGCRDTGYQNAVIPEDRMAEGETLPEGTGDLFPCEWRVYVENGEIQAISNYYTAIDRGASEEDERTALAMAAEAKRATEALLTVIRETGAIPHHPRYEHRDGFDADGIHFSLDFLEARDDSAPMGRRLVMIEGGPAHLRNPNWGAHPTCFGVSTPPAGLALSVDDIRPLSALDA
jgi:hypothetical protein